MIVVGQRGSISVVLAALLAVLLVVAMGVADVTSALVAAGRAQDAADAAALAAVQEIAAPSGRTASEVAAEYAVRNGASLTACSCDPASLAAVVTVRTPVGPMLLFADDRVAEASARAVVSMP